MNQSLLVRAIATLWLCAAATLPLAATEVVKFRAASESEPIVGRYVVTLATPADSDDGLTAEMLARAYGGRLEPFAREGVRAFLITMRSARARTMSADPRVATVTELAADETEPTSAPVAALSIAAAAIPAVPAVTARAPQPRTDWSHTGTLWESGTIDYDGAGHIKQIGDDRYRYDGVGRLTYATVKTPEHLNVQTFDYDRYGNKTGVTSTTVGGTTLTRFSVDPQTNRLRFDSADCGAADECVTGFYDEAGNQKGVASSGEFHWDALGVMTGREWPRERYLYDANDERIARIIYGPDQLESRRFITLRGSDNKVARELQYDATTATWTLAKDYVYRNGTLIASFSNGAAVPDRHYHVDHLGSTRLITDGASYKVAFLSYWPFGEEAPGSERDATQPQRLKFTGHERDENQNGTGLELDYMHARYHNPSAGRFLSIDPGKDWDARQPQSWNMYAYVRNNPLNLVDADGRRSDSPKNHCRGVTSGPCAAANKNWEKPSFGQVDRIFWRAMAKLTLVAVSAAGLPVRVLVGAAATGAALNATKESKKPDATPQTIAGGAIDGAANGVIVRGAKTAVEAVRGGESKDKKAIDDAVSGITNLGSLLLGNDLAIVFGLAPLPPPPPPPPPQEPSGSDTAAASEDEKKKNGS